VEGASLATFRLELIDPQQIVYDGEVNSVMLPGAEGDMTILPGHMRLVTLVNPGMIEVIDAEGNDLRVFVSHAVAEITENSVTVLAERSVMETELSQGHIDEVIVQLQLQLEVTDDETTRTTTRTMISRLEQIKIISRA
jgi:F-type H+-transporting ATPase subunit epsilon